ncbi:hypothetical protein Droror1_Dr00015228 [Drosera rotundifolia]
MRLYCISCKLHRFSCWKLCCSFWLDKFQELKTLQEETEGSQDSERSPPSELGLFLVATGGFLPSGTMLGLGSATQLFYEKPNRGKSSSRKFVLASNIVVCTVGPRSL